MKRGKIGNQKGLSNLLFRFETWARITWGRVFACVALPDRIFTTDTFQKNNKDTEEILKDREYPW